uniref:Trafficking protein particle complex subunit 2-like protein n=1 Tax=Talaromyces marneffei PM1 TaxID=1077442 RepID=A0A093VLW8_TALMA
MAQPSIAYQDLGLLQALDERLAVYGWLTNTGVKILIIVDLAGRHADGAGQKQSITPVTGIKHSDLKPVGAGEIHSLHSLLMRGRQQAFRALQTAYIGLLQNPFYNPDDQNGASPVETTNDTLLGINDKKFITEVKRIGDMWSPNLTII